MVIALLTDFGLEDAYVGVMKGVILGIHPQATIVDLCHSIQPQNVSQAAFVLHTAHKYFPQGTIHVVVVDPGVGTQRRALLLTTPEAYFLAPDNGVLSYIVEEAAPFQAFYLSNPRYWLSPVSATFQGRDIFAPAAAHLARGVPPQKLGEVTSPPLSLPIPRPSWESPGVLQGQVLHIDSFGNLITNIKEEDLPPGEISIEVGEHRLRGLSPSYAQGGELLALIGSSGYLEIAARNESAAKALAAQVGYPIRVRKAP